MAEAKKAAPAKAEAPREPTEAEIKANEAPNPDVVPDPDDQALIAQVPGASDVHRARAHLEADASDEDGPVDTTPPAYVYLDESAAKGGVKMADVASLQGIQVAPDASVVTTVARGDVPFISEGMRFDLDQQGWAIDPMTGRKVVRNT